MHKRLLSVAFGLSLALFATAASSRTYDFDRNTWSADDGDRRASSASHRHRAAYAYRAEGGEEAEPIPRRSVTREHTGARHARGGRGGGTSRSCLTSAASVAQSKYRIAPASSTCSTASVHWTQQCAPIG